MPSYYWPKLTTMVATSSQFSLHAIYRICQLAAPISGFRPGTVYPKKYAHGYCFAVLCCGYTLTDFPYPSGLLHWHCGSLTIAPVPAKQLWWIWINTSCEFIMNDRITTTKQSTTKPCAYFLGYTVSNCIQVKQCAVITHPWPSVYGGLAKLPFKLSHGWVIAST